MKIGIQRSDASNGIIISNRGIYGITATGNAFASVATKSEQKYSLKITGNEKNCRIAATKYQIYANGTEWKDGMNASWGKENLWDPFFGTIEENLH